MTVEATTWTETYQVRSYEADPSGHASMQTLCNYLQESAGNHASRLGLSVEQLTGDNLTWVLAYLHVVVEELPLWRDTVSVETWPSGEDGLYATREFLLRGHDDRLLGRATSAWLLIDLARRRPIRLPDYVREIRVPHRERPLPGPIPRLKPPEGVDAERTFRVRYSDLDLNQHVNNVRYIDWAVESVPREVLQQHRLRAVEVNFRTEAVYGDTVLARAQQVEDTGGPVYAHRLLRAADERDIALARTVWIPGSPDRP